MKIDTEKLLTVTNFAKLKKITRQHVYRLAAQNEITLVKIEDISFVVLDKKADGFERKRTKIKL